MWSCVSWSVRELVISSERLLQVTTGRWRWILSIALLVTTAACSSASELPPPPIEVINQSSAASTEVRPGEWCVDGLFTDGCAAVDAPVPQVLAGCDEQLVAALPDGFSPRPDGPLRDAPAEGGEAWLVEVEEGAVLVIADGSGNWSSASWAFDLERTDEGC
jgi:hypothetical protein